MFEPFDDYHLQSLHLVTSRHPESVLFWHPDSSARPGQLTRSQRQRRAQNCGDRETRGILVLTFLSNRQQHSFIEFSFVQVITLYIEDSPSVPLYFSGYFSCKRSSSTMHNVWWVSECVSAQWWNSFHFYFFNFSNLIRFRFNPCMNNQCVHLYCSLVSWTSVQ